MSVVHKSDKRKTYNAIIRKVPSDKTIGILRKCVEEKYEIHVTICAPVNSQMFGDILDALPNGPFSPRKCECEKHVPFVDMIFNCIQESVNKTKATNIASLFI